MIEEILPNLYRIEVPLPRNPLRAVNSYLIKGDGRFLIIDTGMNMAECISALNSGLQKLDVDLQKTDFFITHFHHDHMGLVTTLASEKSKIYFNRPEAAIAAVFTSESFWTDRFNIYVSNGFPSEELKRSMGGNLGFIFGLKTDIPFTVMTEGDSLEIGDYRLWCIETPGHSPGHTCLYEKDKKLLFSGDHILFDITPNITYYPELDNSLKHYLQGLNKVYPLEVSLVLPGHGSLRDNHRARIKELQKHHELRLNEAVTALESDEKTAYDVAPHITWEIAYKTWEQFPVMQKYFAVGETIAHLEYLVAENRAQKRAADGKILYSLGTPRGADITESDAA